LLLVPLIFYALIVVDPRTHVYTIVPGAAVLGGLGGAWFARRLRARSGASLAASAAAGWFLLCAAYVALLFLQNHPERQRNWSSERPWPALFPVTWSEPPQYGLFGFPYQAGWRTLAANAGDLPQPFASNEEAEITAWYLAGRERTYCGDLTGFVLADNVQDPVPYETSWLESLSLQAAVEGNGRQSLWLYRSGPAADEVKTFSGSTALWLRPESVTPRRPQFGVPVGVTLGDQVKLLGYDLPVRQARPGETIWLTLYWEALAPMAESYQVFVHLYDGEMRAQADGAPGCDLYPTPRWEPREVVRDPHRVQLPANLPPGTYPLLVGMYRLVDGERLAVDGRTDNAIPLTEIKVERGP
jgi:hypothetical protein